MAKKPLLVPRPLSFGGDTEPPDYSVSDEGEPLDHAVSDECGPLDHATSKSETRP